MDRIPETYGIPSGEAYELAWQCLKELQFMPRSLGAQYLAAALELVSRRAELGQDLKGHLYPYLAQIYRTRANCVERNIRYAIESAWSRCSPEVAERYFGYTTHPDKGKPTNREFITTAALWIRSRHG